MSSTEVELYHSSLAQPNESIDFSEPSYDPESHEASELVEEIVARRIGPYRAIVQPNAAYFSAPQGSRAPGFQLEYGLDTFSSGADTQKLITSLVLKGCIGNLTSFTRLWMQTRVGILGRKQDGNVYFFTELAIVDRPTNRFDADIFPPNAVGPSLRLHPRRAEEVVRLLRRASRQP